MVQPMQPFHITVMPTFNTEHYPLLIVPSGIHMSYKIVYYILIYQVQIMVYGVCEYSKSG